MIKTIKLIKKAKLIHNYDTVKKVFNLSPIVYLKSKSGWKENNGRHTDEPDYECSN